MKVILTAFCGKAKSEVLDWPEETGSRVSMLVNDGERPLKLWFELERKAGVSGIGTVSFYQLVSEEVL